jgi:hypothetical protein
MRLRHAAALALMGWYLMIPPPGPHGPNVAVPLSQWSFVLVKRKEKIDHRHRTPHTYVEPYPTFEECEASKEKDLKDSIVIAGDDDPILRDARCVRSDVVKPKLLHPFFVPLSQ